MPEVNGKKFPYTAKGKKMAKAAAKKMKHERTEGKREREMEYGKGKKKAAKGSKLLMEYGVKVRSTKAKKK